MLLTILVAKSDSLRRFMLFHSEFVIAPEENSRANGLQDCLVALPMKTLSLAGIFIHKLFLEHSWNDSKSSTNNQHRGDLIAVIS
jgi:hypothetical protein